jgi:hypothetical protein
LESAVNLQSLVVERRRVADEFRATITYLAMLRAHLARHDLTDEARRHLLPVIEEEAAESRKLSDELLQLDVAILKMKATPDAPSSPSPLLAAPVVF